MRKINIILIILFACLFHENAFSQSHSMRIYTGYAYGISDKRYDFLNPSGIAKTVISKINENTPDDEYAVGLGYSYQLKERLALNFDLGYAKLVQDFILPVSMNNYFEIIGEPFLWRHKSDYHMIQIAPSFDYTMVNQNVKFGVSLQAIGNISFRKHITDYNLSRNKVEYFSTEINPGLFIKYWRIRADIGVRALHFKYRDDALVNNGLNPDKYNPFKMRFTLSYDLFRW